MTDIERIELAARRIAAAHFNHRDASNPAISAAFHAFADELAKMETPRQPEQG
jgi:hypothetical protein